ncbi:Sporulation initiation inhibitor protein Soj [Planctomycetales bacterium 10988]|nr:Sporulation initiation inhibitor protein Soj [Planctomycetales bacterium 10988]
MRKIAILNQKGGVGKTSTTVNLAAALAALGKRVCVVDLDPQAHATLHLGLTPAPGQASMYHVLTDPDTSLAEVRRLVGENLWLIGSDIDLAAAEVELAGVVGREMILRDKLNADQEPFDFILFDCPPSLGVLTINALAAVDEVFIPLQPHFLPLHGLSKLLETIQLVATRLSGNLRLSGVVMCLYEQGTRLSAEVSQDVSDFLEQSKASKTPWSQAQLFQTHIRRNIRLAEAPSFGQSIFDYAPDSNGAEDYMNLAYEVMAQSEETQEPAAPSFSRLTKEEEETNASTQQEDAADREPSRAYYY